MAFLLQDCWNLRSQNSSQYELGKAKSTDYIEVKTKGRVILMEYLTTFVSHLGSCFCYIDSHFDVGVERRKEKKKKKSSLITWLWDPNNCGIQICTRHSGMSTSNIGRGLKIMSNVNLWNTHLGHWVIHIQTISRMNNMKMIGIGFRNRYKISESQCILLYGWACKFKLSLIIPERVPCELHSHRRGFGLDLNCASMVFRHIFIHCHRSIQTESLNGDSCLTPKKKHQLNNA